MIALRTGVVSFGVEGVLFSCRKQERFKAPIIRKSCRKRQLDPKKDSGGKHEQRTCKDL